MPKPTYRLSPAQRYLKSWHLIEHTSPQSTRCPGCGTVIHQGDHMAERLAHPWGAIQPYDRRCSSCTAAWSPGLHQHLFLRAAAPVHQWGHAGQTCRRCRADLVAQVCRREQDETLLCIPCVVETQQAAGRAPDAGYYLGVLKPTA